MTRRLLINLIKKTSIAARGFLQGARASRRRGLSVWILLVGSASLAAGEVSITRQAELRHLLREDCGACHGLTMQGGLGSPLTREALADKPTESLVYTLLEGRPGTAMPPWRPFISEDEAQWLVEQLQRGISP